MPFTRSSTRRPRATANNQPPALHRQDAEVIYETVNDQGLNVDLSSGVDQLLAFFDQTYDGQRHTVNTPASRASQVAPAAYMVNGRRIEPEPQLPAYTQNPSSAEIRMDITPSETLPTYADESKEQGKGKDDKAEVPPRSQ
ncbi:hypothetical protein N0V85_008871 [Neurospora sp. IMI 360204]|nr:hypothetical protein N0V85_008871 [Neurospora sp. IMI 360204]